jgi:hypothetical protein
MAKVKFEINSFTEFMYILKDFDYSLHEWSSNEVAHILMFDDPNTLNNYIKKLKDKGALIFNKGSYSVNKLLNPQIKKIEISII